MMSKQTNWRKGEQNSYQFHFCQMKPEFFFLGGCAWRRGEQTFPSVEKRIIRKLCKESASEFLKGKYLCNTAEVAINLLSCRIRSMSLGPIGLEVLLNSVEVRLEPHGCTISIFSNCSHISNVSMDIYQLTLRFHGLRNPAFSQFL